eukprot:TRINITY_DN2918_c4_g1_i1.p1 TRINITY_DN2918_c4_g1~~TRINITY_DN2918_c4_g1_i1.p1  ORF type:complete len:429 (-),score=133.79 TRINITY_DN2918_c4_g1_i1:367-1653(-)
MGALLLILLYTFVDILGFSIILPLLPFIAEEFQASPSAIGWLVSSNAIAQFISAPIIGKLSDHYGRRPLMIVCLTATVTSFALLATASSFEVVFASRVLDGMLGGNIALAQACVADVTSPENRARGMGLVGAAFGVGFVVGPAMGGVLAHMDLRFPAIAAALLSLLNLIGVIFFFKEPMKANQAAPAPHAPSALVGLSSILSASMHPHMLVLLFLRFCACMVFTMFESTFSLYAKHIIHLDPRQSSYLLAYVGLMFSFMQGGAVGRLSKYMREGSIVTAAFFVSAVACALWSATMTVREALVVLLPFSFAAGALNCLISSMISQRAQLGDVGGALGVSASIASLSRIVAPLVGGYLMETVSFSSPSVVSAVLSCVAFVACAFIPEVDATIEKAAAVLSPGGAAKAGEGGAGGEADDGSHSVDAHESAA